MNRYQISFINKDGELKQYDIRTDDAGAEAIHAELTAKIGDSVQDLQVYKPDRTPSKIVDLIIALGNDTRDMDWRRTDKGQALMEAAAAMDIRAETNPQEAFPATIEFVWENGGGNDNAFAETVMLAQPDVNVIHQVIEQVVDNTPIGEIVIYEEKETDLVILPVEDAIALALENA